jgi:hypothetical protein
MDINMLFGIPFHNNIIHGLYHFREHLNIHTLSSLPDMTEQDMFLQQVKNDGIITKAKLRLLRKRSNTHSCHALVFIYTC